jgi:hypothetical protein
MYIGLTLLKRKLSKTLPNSIFMIFGNLFIPAENTRHSEFPGHIRV